MREMSLGGRYKARTHKHKVDSDYAPLSGNLLQNSWVGVGAAFLGNRALSTDTSRARLMMKVVLAGLYNCVTSLMKNPW